MPRRLRSRLAALSALTLAALMPDAGARADTVAEIASRGQKVRALVLMPPAKPAGAIVLLTGGDGRLDIGSDGVPTTSALNQLVRTRADYARAGFVVVVPDVAPDLKQGNGVKPGSRFSQTHADDVAAVIRHARTLATPVHLVATSRGTLPATKVATTKTSGPERPDTLVITAGMLMHIDAKQPSAERSVGNLDKVTQPVLLLHHENDGCAYTPASAVARAKPLFKQARRVDVRILSGGQAMPAGADPCLARSPHGFLGLDDVVVKTVSNWVRGQVN